jgi:hypothetical protein
VGEPRVAASSHGFDGLMGLVRARGAGGEQPRGLLPPARLDPADGAAGRGVDPAGQPGVAVLQPPGCVDTPLRFGPKTGFSACSAGPSAARPMTWC